jgi:signal transduction histidine kinase
MPLLLNGVTLALSLSFLLIVLWQDWRKELNQFFAVFLFFVIFWNIGALFYEGARLVSADSAFNNLALIALEIGFTGSSVAIYALTTVLVGVQTQRWRWLVFSSLLLVVGFRLLVAFSDVNITVFDANVSADDAPFVRFGLYLLFNAVTLFIVWRYRRKLRSRVMLFAVLLFVVGQSAGFLNPQLPTVVLSTTISAIAALVLSYTILQQEIIQPLSERRSQLETMHRVSLSIITQLSLDKVLDEIATQAVGWLNADAACIFLKDTQGLALATVYNMPPQYIGTRLNSGDGVAGQVTTSSQSLWIENYRRDWKGVADVPLADEVFGSVIGVPLLYGKQALGALMVIGGTQGRAFSREDVRLLEMLGAQAAVAIDHSRRVNQQSALTQQVEAAHNQLQSLLVSTENPVLAVNRHFELIFANPAAQRMFALPAPQPTQSALLADDATQHKRPVPHPAQKPITQLLPRSAFPSDVRRALRELRQQRVHIYEVSHTGKVYLCHLAYIGGAQHSERGWVAVLNDVTQLIELDRLKSEMIRMTSHDLKNPLQGALANLELLKDDLADVDNSEISESVATIEKQLYRMYRIISGILDLERVKSGQRSVEACAPAALVQHAVDELQPFAQDKQITLRCQIAPNLPDFYGDAEQFERALSNLIENAIKFTPPEGQVWVTAVPQDNGLSFTVRDTGVGIPAALHEKVFERFYRAQQKGVEHVSGSGLGLSLVQAIVQNHNGTIQLRSAEGVGTTFIVHIPIDSKVPKTAARLAKVF